MVREGAISRSLRAIPTAARPVLLGNAAAALGNGLTMPLLVVYLGQVRGLGTTTAGLLVAGYAVVALVCAAPIGSLVDRLGPRPVLMTGLGIKAIGVVVLSQAASLPLAIIAVTVMAIGDASSWAPQSALLGRITPPADRQRVFGMQFMLLNLGLGIGGLISAVIANVERPQTFTTLYCIDAATFLVYIGCLASMRREDVGPVDQTTSTQERGSYRLVFGDRALRRLALGATLLLTAGYGSLEVGLATYLTVLGDLSVGNLAVVYAVNTGVVVLAQLFIIDRIQGRSRTRLAALVGLLWGGSWIIIGASIDLPLVGSVVLACIGAGVFALGETVWSPVGPAIVNDLAPEHMRGRYNAVASWTWGLAGSVGPAVAGIMLGAGLASWWIVLVVLACVGASGILLRLRGLLTPEQDGLSVDRLPAKQVAPGVAGG